MRKGGADTTTEANGGPSMSGEAPSPRSVRAKGARVRVVDARTRSFGTTEEGTIWKLGNSENTRARIELPQVLPERSLSSDFEDESAETQAVNAEVARLAAVS